MLSILLLGFLIGVWHALDMDHIAAIITFVAGNNSSRRRAIGYGAAWGVGHATMLLIMMLLTMTFDLKLSDGLASVMQFMVGGMLVFLALDLFRRLATIDIHSHPHCHVDHIVHDHLHAHLQSEIHTSESHAHAHQDGLLCRALLVGLMHGLAGSATLLLLVLNTMSSKTASVVYVVLFGLGSTLGMAVLSKIISMQLQRSDMCSPRLARKLRSVAALVTFAVGIVVIVKVGSGAGVAVKI